MSVASKIAIKFQPCGSYVSLTRVEDCAEDEEITTFMSNAKFSLRTTDKYINSYEFQYESVIKARIMPLISFTGQELQSQSIESTLTLSQTSASFRDDLFGAFGVDMRFMTPHSNSQQVSSASAEDSGFRLRFDLHHTAKVYTRQAFDFWMYLAYLGGLSVALSWIHGVFVSIYNPAIFRRSVIRHNFKFDSN